MKFKIVSLKKDGKEVPTPETDEQPRCFSVAGLIRHLSVCLQMGMMEVGEEITIKRVR